MSSSQVYKISSTLYLDTINKCYKRILIIDREPEGPLRNYTRKLKKNKLSPFDVDSCQKHYSKSCVIAIYDFIDRNKLLTVADIGELFSFLFMNGYVIAERLSKLVSSNTRLNNKDDFICFIELPKV